MSIKRRIQRQQEPDTLWGIDRYPGSGAYGELVVPQVRLWRRIGGITKGGNDVLAVVAHNTAVMVLREKIHDGAVWCWVEVPGEAAGHGWVRASLLLQRGAKEFEG